MRLTFFIIVMALLCAQPAAAVTVTSEEAETIALKAEPGTLKGVDRRRTTAGDIYEFEIEKRNGTKIEIAVDSRTGNIVGRRIRELGEGVPMPKAEVPKFRAEEIAYEHIRDLTPGKRQISIENTRYFLRRGKLLYEIHVKKYNTDYEVLIDATTGEVLSVDEML